MDSETVAAAPQTLAKIAERIRERIRRGTFAPGQRLIEVDLADEFQVGRGRIREVFKILVGEGFLEFIENRGVYVRRFTRAEILEMGQVREVLEGLAARLAAEMPKTQEQVDQLRAHQAALDAAANSFDIDGYNRENFAYHATICGMSENRHIEAFLYRVRLPLYRLQLPRSFTEDSMSRSNSDHQVITAAIISGNPDAAEAAMRAHVRTGNQHVASLPHDYFV
ncbi:GntR family transcriptional regulator [Mariluticola halotolerans]|uniref:GntR family transcriptional regulator n=1 Tax=Mariluticola halotolerans TaxID=2909283 RepID=UPI0026E3D9C8|nr:GntR family transcriptional regulator [Mariluticola halotolerans]UJQ94863.1 GntR family transcriptional regulator [Mariluticola halotolerans]